ncbi:MAG TPA: cytochrome c [Burkholderiales bacterium]|nr:cytochrome c [Burkholderiales bacterium]
MKAMNKIWIAMVAAIGFAGAGNAIAGGDAAKGKEKAAVCTACHGQEGNAPIAPEYPRLAGQPDDYLEKALNDYKAGKRKNPLMGPQAQNLSKQDMKDLAAYFSSLSGDLKVKY